MWRIVGCVLCTDSCPDNLWQYFIWCHFYLPDGERFYTFGLAALCWAMWNCRNKKIFEFKELKSPFNVVYSACGYISYWAGLLSGEDREAMERGSKMLRINTSSLMRICVAPSDAMRTG
ncbi:hypothetical protein CFC21_002207 [Triticum aestivum]|uniref:Uncharacterized protein n=1 Tax=Triticum aestivum TaxID=4565 RepID=A0A3B5Y0I9_WHEAT|nr:hypothetical protein CFC21_002207 [Triticum aestivum]